MYTSLPIAWSSCKRIEETCNLYLCLPQNLHHSTQFLSWLSLHWVVVVDGTSYFGYVIFGIHKYEIYLMKYLIPFYLYFSCRNQYHFLGSIGFNPMNEPLSRSRPLHIGHQWMETSIFMNIKHGIMEHWYTSFLSHKLVKGINLIN